MRMPRIPSSRCVQCFLETMSKHDVAKGTYRVQGVEAGSQSSIHVKISGPREEVEYSKANAVSGKFAFNANEGGEHRVCFLNTNDRSVPNTVFRIAFEFTAGADANDYS